MPKPTFDPRPGKQWALKLWPGGRIEWRQVDPDDIMADGLYAADYLSQGNVVIVEDEQTAADTLRWAGEGNGA